VSRVSSSGNGSSIWAWVPALLLGSMLAGLGTLAYLAIDDPHFALEPNYYDKAVHWDRAREQARQTDALGLQLSLAPLRLSPSRNVELELRITDRAGLALSGAEVRLQAFPNAYAQRSQTLVLTPGAPGTYRGTLANGTIGLWELRFSIQHPSGQSVTTLRQDVVKGGAA
jgi:hypothetical protein